MAASDHNLVQELHWCTERGSSIDHQQTNPEWSKVIGVPELVVEVLIAVVFHNIYAVPVVECK